MLREILGLLVWIIANFSYRAMVRDGEGGFRRLVAFCLGWPGTFVSYLGVKPPRRGAVPRPDARYRAQLELKEERDLLLEIRHDRARRISRRRLGEDVAVDEKA